MTDDNTLPVPPQSEAEASSNNETSANLTAWTGWYPLMLEQYRVEVNDNDLEENLNADELARVNVYKRTLRYVLLSQRFRQNYESDDGNYPRTRAQEKREREETEAAAHSQQSNEAADPEFWDHNAINEERRLLDLLLKSQGESMEFWLEPGRLNRLQAISRGLPDPAPINFADTVATVNNAEANSFRIGSIIRQAMADKNLDAAPLTNLLAAAAGNPQAIEYYGRIVHYVVNNPPLNADRRIRVLEAVAGNADATPYHDKVLECARGNWLATNQRVPIFSAVAGSTRSRENLADIIRYATDSESAAQRVDPLADSDIIHHVTSSDPPNVAQRIDLLIHAASNPIAVEHFGKIVRYAIDNPALNSEQRCNLLSAVGRSTEAVDHFDAIIQYAITGPLDEHKRDLLSVIIDNPEATEHLGDVLHYVTSAPDIDTDRRNLLLVRAADKAKAAEDIETILLHALTHPDYSPEQRSNIVDALAGNKHAAEYFGAIIRYAQADPDLETYLRVRIISSLAGNSEAAEYVGGLLHYAATDPHLDPDARGIIFGKAAGNEEASADFPDIVRFAKVSTDINHWRRREILMAAANNPQARDQLARLVTPSAGIPPNQNENIRIAARLNSRAVEYLENHIDYATDAAVNERPTIDERGKMLCNAAANRRNTDNRGTLITWTLIPQNITAKWRTDILATAVANPQYRDHYGTIIEHAINDTFTFPQRLKILTAATNNPDAGGHIGTIVQYAMTDLWLERNERTPLLTAVLASPHANTCFDDVVPQIFNSDYYSTAQQARMLAAAAGNPALENHLRTICEYVVNKSTFNASERAMVLTAAAGNSRAGEYINNVINLAASDKQLGISQFAEVLTAAAKNEQATNHLYYVVRYATGNHDFSNGQRATLLAAVTNNPQSASCLSMVIPDVIQDKVLSIRQKVRILSNVASKSWGAVHCDTVINFAMNNALLTPRMRLRLLTSAAGNPKIGPRLNTIIALGSDPRLSPQDRTTLLVAVADNVNITQAQIHNITLQSSPSNMTDQNSRAKIDAAISRTNARSLHQNLFPNSEFRWCDLTLPGGKIPGNSLGFCKGAGNEKKGTTERTVVLRVPSIDGDGDANAHKYYRAARRQIMIGGGDIYKIEGDINRHSRLIGRSGHALTGFHRQSEALKVLPDGEHLKNKMTSLQNIGRRVAGKLKRP